MNFCMAACADIKTDCEFELFSHENRAVLLMFSLNTPQIIIAVTAVQIKNFLARCKDVNIDRYKCQV